MNELIELLPLYAELQGHPKLEIVKHYARACVAHATAAKDAEIEELRADLADYMRIANTEATRAEQLAEALRGWWEARRPVSWTEDQHRSCPHVNLATDAEEALATALLRAQEEWK